MFRWLMKKPKISLEITPEQDEALKAECTARGISLSDLVRERLFEKKEVAPPTPPAVATPTARHPCLHLDPSIPQNYTARDCKGTCRSPAQYGRPCFWASAQAPNCDKFVPLIVRR